MQLQRQYLGFSKQEKQRIQIIYMKSLNRQEKLSFNILFEQKLFKYYEFIWVLYSRSTFEYLKVTFFKKNCILVFQQITIWRRLSRIRNIKLFKKRIRAELIRIIQLEKQLLTKDKILNCHFTEKLLIRKMGVNTRRKKGKKCLSKSINF